MLAVVVMWRVTTSKLTDSSTQRCSQIPLSFITNNEVHSKETCVRSSATSSGHHILIRNINKFVSFCGWKHYHLDAFHETLSKAQRTQGSFWNHDWTIFLLQNWQNMRYIKWEKALCKMRNSEKTTFQWPKVSKSLATLPRHRANIRTGLRY